MTEDVPADLDALVAPLHPNMFNNPAADVQQPHGDAIVVAGRLAALGARVTIRLADWFPGWPYQFSNMTDWLDKVAQTVSRKQASGVDNYYGYEIWNEPGGTWTSSMPFNDFWKQTYDKLRQLDPDAEIIGPSYSYYNGNSLKSFLTFARDNNCLPDIVSWHELGGGNLSANFQGYRALEQSLGIGPLPISINEYSGPERIDDEGQPGASAPIIAKFERFGIDTACISYWDVPHPGRLGTLLATDSARNGGWWFYKWYGDMSGDMVATTPPAPNDVSTLDGFANLDTSKRFASVAFAGVNDGTIAVVIQGFSAAPFFGSTVHAVVEHTPWVSRSTVVNATETLQTLDLPITADKVTITIPNANAKDGYRVYLTSNDDGSGTAGDAGVGSDAGQMSAPSTDAGIGTAGTGGVAGMTAGSGGQAAGGAGGAISSGAPTGGSGGAGFAGTGGSGGLGGSGGSAGAQFPLPAAQNAGADQTSAAGSGCGCHLAGSTRAPCVPLLLVLLLATGLRRRHRRRRQR